MGWPRPFRSKDMVHHGEGELQPAIALRNEPKPYPEAAAPWPSRGPEDPLRLPEGAREGRGGAVLADEARGEDPGGGPRG